MVKLKPCPFCGSEAAYIAQNYMGQHYVRCPDCGCTMWGLDTGDEVTEKQAAAYWNKRKETRR